MAVVAVVAAVLAATVSMAGSMQKASQAKSASKAYDAQAQVSREWGKVESAQSRRESARRQSQSRASVGASGLEATGSISDVLSDEAIEGELQALMISSKREQEARNAEFQASSLRAQAKGTRALAPLSALSAGFSAYATGGGSLGSTVAATNGASNSMAPDFSSGAMEL